ncbi:MAG: hypothetical protein KC416_13175, partial [Myxococcales bacterium]|nr:hypothetical protein [Myxococcales bacterium]
VREFFTAGCGSPGAVGQSQSYAMDASTRSNLTYSEYMLVQYLDGVPDTDDAYRITHGSDLFPDTDVVENTPVAMVCDLDGSVCDSTDVYWKYIGDFWYPNSLCNSGSSASTTYRGNYGICHNGVSTGYASGSFAGNRSAYDETKLIKYTTAASDDYQERIFVR